MRFLSGGFAAREYKLAKGAGASRLDLIFAKSVIVFSFASDFSAASPSDLIPRAGEEAEINSARRLQGLLFSKFSRVVVATKPALCACMGMDVWWCGWIGI